MKNSIYNKQDTIRSILPEYGKRKLISYADSLRDLAHSYSGQLDRMEVSKELGVSDRQAILFEQRLMENREIVAKQLEETAKILQALAAEAYQTSYSLEKLKKQIQKVLQENDLQVKEIYAIENKNGYMEIGITLRAIRQDCYSALELAEFLSQMCKRKMTLSGESVSYIYDEYVTVSFKEKVNYYISAGVAKAMKEDEPVSGDNYVLKEYGHGSYLAVISDGMGSGLRAYKDSEMVVELVEKFLGVGYELEPVVVMINDILLSQLEDPRTATMDVCEINLYSGECSFLKVGAAASFLKREKKVSKITSYTLPLGVFGNIEPERRQLELQDGDYIIMVSDGILDSISGLEGETILKEALRNMNFENPKEMANLILGLAIKKSGGIIRDDMTVIVLALLTNT